MSTEIIDDEMEAMLREIESIGMAPAAAVKPDGAHRDLAAAAISAMKAPDPAPVTETMDDLEAAIAGIEGAAAAEVKPPFEGGKKITVAETPVEDAKVVNPDDEVPVAEILAATTKVVEEDGSAILATLMDTIRAEPNRTAAFVLTAAAEAGVSSKTILTEMKNAGLKLVEPKPVTAVVEEVEVEVGPTPTDPENVVKAAASTPAAAGKPASAAADLIDHEQIKRDISINMTDLDSMLTEHPGLQLHYALKTADARRAYERMKSGVEVLEAQLDSSYREKLADGVKKPTEAAIRNALVADPKYSSAQAKLIDAQHVWKMCEAIENSFYSRKDILLEVARDRRKEKEGAMRVMDAEHTAASAAELRKKIVDSLKK